MYPAVNFCNFCKTFNEKKNTQKIYKIWESFQLDYITLEIVWPKMENHDQNLKSKD